MKKINIKNPNMADSSEVKALEKISTEISESQIKITLSSQCIKGITNPTFTKMLSLAQAFLVDKLRKQTERQKEICSFVSSSNLKLLAEIKQAELEIKSLIIAQETIKSGNIELKKEFLLAKEKKTEIAERIRNGVKKYENLWIESKKRYESIPYVQKILQAINNTKTLKDNNTALERKIQVLEIDYKTKQKLFAKLNRSRIIELADYLMRVMPNNIKCIQEKSSAITIISKEIDDILKVQQTVVNQPLTVTPMLQKDIFNDKVVNTKLSDDGWLNICTNNERDMIMMPRLQFTNADFDLLNAKLDQIKFKKVKIADIKPENNPIENLSGGASQRIHEENEFSIFFAHHNSRDKNNAKEIKHDTYSKRKLINILEDVNLNNDDAYNMVSKVDIAKLKGVQTIGTENTNNKENTELEDILNKKDEEIEEIDLTQTKTENNNILNPPSQFLDITQEKLFDNSQQQVEVIVQNMHIVSMPESSGQASQISKNSQENINKKRVSFELPLSIQEITDQFDEEDHKQAENENIEVNETIESQVDISLVIDESYSKIKDMMLKKHNLDLSPQFVYAKNRMNNLQDNCDNNQVVSSKFFQSSKPDKIDNYENNKVEGEADGAGSKEINQEISFQNAAENVNDDITMNVDEFNCEMRTDRSVTGLLFNHGTQGIPDSLNVSISTTGFEEGDTDYPHCIDSSLLLSPKADLSMPMSSDNAEISSQEVPNFLSGLRKTGLSIFGQSSTTNSKADASGQNQGNNFNFNFGGGEQKNRGGLFSMFR